jgi:CubicO group peptidase (beta-lactamase class C family)
MGSATGLTPAGLARLRAVAERHVGDEKVPGLVTLVACGSQVHTEALGTLSAGGRPVARDSIFRIASTTKPVTAVVTLALAAEGLIGLAEPVDRLTTAARSAGTAGWARPGWSTRPGT